MIENYLYDVKRGARRDTFLSKKMTIQLKGIATLMVFASHIPQVANIPTGVANLLAPMGYHGVAIFPLKKIRILLSSSKRELELFCRP